MKRNILKSVMVVLMALFSLNADAYDAYIDGIYYNLIPKAKTAEVTSGDKKYTGAVVIPASVEKDGVTYSVISIGYEAFYMCSNLTSVTIPRNIISIGTFAFSCCFNLNSVYITDLAAWCQISFGSYVFSNSNSIPHLYLNGDEIKDLVIPEGLTSISRGGFSEFSGLTSVTIPNSVTSIGDQAFRGCSGLISVTIPNSVTSIGKFAFQECSGLTSVTIPNNITSIEYGTFEVCSSLTSIIIPNSVTSIGESAFSGCSGLTSVTISNSVVSIGERAFSGCI